MTLALLNRCWHWCWCGVATIALWLMVDWCLIVVFVNSNHCHKLREEHNCQLRGVVQGPGCKVGYSARCRGGARCMSYKCGSARGMRYKCWPAAPGRASCPVQGGAAQGVQALLKSTIYLKPVCWVRVIVEWHAFFDGAMNIALLQV